jgi:hypothetical protein
LRISEPSSSEAKKTPDQRRAERMARLEWFEKFKIRNEARGWQVKSSRGISVWQFIPGGKFLPRTSTKNG